MTIYVFGNPFVKGDSGVFPVADKLRKSFPGTDFRVTDPNEDFPPKDERNPVILDTVKGLIKVELLRFEDLQNIEKSPVSPHDYDLLLHLLLLKKLGKIDSVTIVGIPFGMNAEAFYPQVFAVISSLLSGNEKRRTYTDQTRG